VIHQFANVGVLSLSIIVFANANIHHSVTACNRVRVCVFSVCNVALNRPSYQSTLYYDETFGPHLCNDGRWTDVNMDMSNRVCAHSELETNPWWAVDLGVPLSVQEVFFTNRGRWGV